MEKSVADGSLGDLRVKRNLDAEEQSLRDLALEASNGILEDDESSEATDDILEDDESVEGINGMLENDEPAEATDGMREDDKSAAVTDDVFEADESVEGTNGMLVNDKGSLEARHAASKDHRSRDATNGAQQGLHAAEATNGALEGVHVPRASPGGTDATLQGVPQASPGGTNGASAKPSGLRSGPALRVPGFLGNGGGARTAAPRDAGLQAQPAPTSVATAPPSVAAVPTSVATEIISVASTPTPVASAPTSVATEMTSAEAERTSVAVAAAAALQNSLDGPTSGRAGGIPGDAAWALGAREAGGAGLSGEAAQKKEGDGQEEAAEMEMGGRGVEMEDSGEGFEAGMEGRAAPEGAALDMDTFDMGAFEAELERGVRERAAARKARFEEGRVAEAREERAREEAKEKVKREAFDFMRQVGQNAESVRAAAGEHNETDAGDGTRGSALGPAGVGGADLIDAIVEGRDVSLTVGNGGSEGAGTTSAAGPDREAAYGGRNIVVTELPLGTGRAAAQERQRLGEKGHAEVAGGGGDAEVRTADFLLFFFFLRFR